MTMRSSNPRRSSLLANRITVTQVPGSKRLANSASRRRFPDVENAATQRMPGRLHVRLAGRFRRSRRLLVLLMLGVLAAMMPAATMAQGLDRPVRVIPGAAADTFYVGSHGSGVVTIVRAGVSRNVRVAGELADLAAVLQSDFLIAVNTTDSWVGLLDTTDSNLRVVRQVEIRRPSRVVMSASGLVCHVASTAGREVTTVSVPGFEILRRVALPFAPQEMLALPDGRCLVADAFGGRLAMLGRSDDQPVQSELVGHHIRGLLLHGDEVLVSHQILSSLARTEFADVHWGTLMQNVVSRVRLGNLTDGRLTATTLALGDTGRGAADPGSLAELPDGRVAVVLSGVDEVMVSTLPDAAGAFQFASGTRTPVGRRPVDVAITADGTLLIANLLDNTVTAVRPDGSTTLHGEAPATRTAAERGEVAFFSGRMSHDGWMSCSSCHVDGHTSGARADTLGDGQFGTPKLIPSLRGVAETGPWGWRGNFASLEKQVVSSLRSTMYGPGDEDTAGDIAAFLETLQPRRAASADLQRGPAAFTDHGCVRCHQPPVFTSPRVWDVGLADEAGTRAFNPPSLLGVGDRFAFLHDGRAGTLPVALETHVRLLGKTVPSTDMAAIEAWLRSL